MKKSDTWRLDEMEKRKMKETRMKITKENKNKKNEGIKIIKDWKNGWSIDQLNKRIEA